MPETLPGIKYNPKWSNLIDQIDRLHREGVINFRDKRKLYDITIADAAKASGKGIAGLVEFPE
jgi:hypothetical protein